MQPSCAWEEGECLSIFGETYTFIRQHYHSPHRIWKSVRRELQIFISITPLIWRNLAAPWDSEVVAVDASTWGLGATSCDFSPSEVKDLGRFSERWRFTNEQHYRPRASAFGADVALTSQDSGAAIWATQQTEARGSRPPIQVVEPKQSNDVFVQVPFDTMDKQWKVCGRYRWKRFEAIPVLEARASLFAVKHALRRVSSFNKRHLVLSDSISAVCALEKGRGRAFKMRRVISQQIGALVLGSNTSFCYRWIPSEWNVSDGPSRGSRFPSKPSPFSKRDDSSFPSSREPTQMSKAKSEEKEVTDSDRQSQVEEGDCGDEGKQKTDAGRGGIASKCFSGRELPSPLSRELEKDGDSSRGEVQPVHSGSRSRPRVGRDAGIHVRRGGGFECRTVHVGSHTFQAPSPEVTEAINATSQPAINARLEKDGSSKVQASSSMGGHVFDRHALPQASTSSGSLDDCNLLCPLFEARRSHKVESHGSCEASADFQERQGSLGRCTASSRGGDQQQDRRVRRDRDVRSRRAQVPPNCHLSVEGVTKDESPKLDLQPHLHAVEGDYMVEAGKALNLESIGPIHPYRLRHGGA